MNLSVAGGERPGVFGLLMMLMLVLGGCSGGASPPAAGAAGGSEAGASASSGIQPVGTGAPGDQELPALACNASGDCIIAWDRSGQDGSPGGIYARRYRIDGQPQGAPFQVTTDTVGRQLYPAVGIDAQGRFVVAWVSDHQDTAGFSVRARRFAADATPLGGGFRVDAADFLGRNVYPQLALAMDGSGDFVLAWGERQAVLGGLKIGYIVVRPYAADGTARGGPVTIAGGLSPLPRAPVVAMDGQGRFMVVWDDDGNGPGVGIMAQRFSGSAVATGPSFRVDAAQTALLVDRPAVAMNAVGAAAIVWETLHPDLTPAGVMLSRYAADGSIESGPTTVAGPTTLQRFPSVAIGPSGEALVVASGDRGIFARDVGAGTLPRRVDAANPPTSVLYPLAALVGPDRCLLVWQRFLPGLQGRDVVARACPGA